MSRTVYAIASGKGGVGKTTTTVNLGAALAGDGHAVVIVDTDLGMANVAGFLDFDIHDATLHEVLAGDADLDDAIYAAPGDLDVVPSSTDIETFARAETTRLREIVSALRERYDYVLLDTGAGISHDTVLPLGLADEVLLVSTPDVASVSDTAKTGDLTERVGGTVAGAVLTKRSSNILDAEDVEATLGTDVLAVVPTDDAVPTSIDAGRPAVVFAPTSPAALAYRDLATVLTADDRVAARAELGDVSAETGSDGAADAAPSGEESETEIEAADEGQGDSAEADPLADESALDETAVGAPDEQSDDGARPDAEDVLGIGADTGRELRDAIGEREDTETASGAASEPDVDAYIEPAEGRAESTDETADDPEWDDGSIPDGSNLATVLAGVDGEVEEDAMETEEDEAEAEEIVENETEGEEDETATESGFFGKLTGIFR